MTIAATIVADSISAEGKRITSIQARYPRFIHSELMTHRVFSRNASSSRAIPVARLIEDVERDPAMPIHWGKNQPGMQAREEHNASVFMPREPDEHDSVGGVYGSREEAWLGARDWAISAAREFSRAGYHKQIVNRILEPFAHINVLISATEWDNFFELRRHPDAQPEIHALANAMWDAQQGSEPVELSPGEWHLPYVSILDWDAAKRHLKIGRVTRDEPRFEEIQALLVKVSVARCARVSYLTHDLKTPEIAKDLKLYEDLVGAVPLHASPAEHQATPDGIWYDTKQWQKPELHGNFVGWIQNRKLIEGQVLPSRSI
jgi:hypothetical protein